MLGGRQRANPNICQSGDNVAPYLVDVKGVAGLKFRLEKARKRRP
jgi:hypothetical protein